MKKPSKRKMASNENGTALVTTIFGILIGTLIGVSLTYGALITLTISVNDRDTTEAFYLADAGIVHASILIKKAKKGSYSAILKTADNKADTGDELSAPPEVGLWAAADSIPAGSTTSGGFTFGGGRYFVSIRNDTAAGEKAKDDSNGILIISSTGIGRDGASATLEAVVETVSIPIPGILANGNAKFTNHLKVLGSQGYIQINGDPIFTGVAKSACAEKQFHILGASIPLPDVNVGPACGIVPVEGTDLLFNQPPAIPPIIDIPKLRSQYKPVADFVFKDNGEIYPQTNGIERVLSLSAIELPTLGLDGWAYNAAKKRWSHSADNRLPDGNYYFMDTNVSMTKGGDLVDPPKVSVFAEGHIFLNNEIALQPNLPGYALITANDIEMSSKYSTVGNPGLVYAYGQIKFSNTAFIVGGMIAADFYRSDGTSGPDANDPAGTNLVDRDKGVMQITGPITIVSSDFGNVVGSEVVSWREVRN